MMILLRVLPCLLVSVLSPSHVEVVVVVKRQYSLCKLDCTSCGIRAQPSRNNPAWNPLEAQPSDGTARFS